MVALKVYTVRSGDSLSRIASKHKLSSWKALYEAPCNAGFRKKRLNPNRIQPGDKLLIPPDPLDAALRRMAALEKLRGVTVAMFRKQECVLDKDFKKINKLGNTIDTIAMVSSILVNLGGLAKDGIKAASLSGKELAAANAAMVKTHVKNNAVFFSQLGGSQVKLTGEDGLAWCIGKVLLKSWGDMWSPSYWAKRISGVDPEIIHKQAKNHLDIVRKKSLAQIEMRIKQTKKLISWLKSERNTPLPR